MPLIAIDLIIENTETNQVLLGYRKNEPAKNFWFIPGGRIFKNESFSQAMRRIFQQELGISFPASTAYEIHGVYDHFYENCFYEKDPNYTNTHYVVIAVKIKLSNTIIMDIHPDAQHEQMLWMKTADILSRNDVHSNTKRYFMV